MARRTPSQLNMLLAVDKPVGCTSHDVVSVSYTHLTLPTIA